MVFQPEFCRKYWMVMVFICFSILPKLSLRTKTYVLHCIGRFISENVLYFSIWCSYICYRNFPTLYGYLRIFIELRNWENIC